MRWSALFFVLSSLSCGSENDLFAGERAPDGTKEPLTGTQEIPEGASALKGRVCTPDGQGPVVFADVTVHHDGGPSTTQTDSDGAFSLVGLPPGTWEVQIQKGSFEIWEEVVLERGATTDLSLDSQGCIPVEQGEVKIAVVTGAYDHIGDILSFMGFSFDTVRGVGGTDYVDFLRDPGALARYDIVFFNCGMGERWLDHQAEISGNLKDYVRSGGSIYASDWAYYLVESGWPNQHEFVGPDQSPYGAQVGNRQDLLADVIDPAMSAALGSDTAQIKYNLGGWAAIESTSGDTLLEGVYRYNGNQQRGPLATRFEDGSGTVLYTSFHNESQSTNDMVILLQEIILSL